jgi:hypothetical protein
VNAEARQLRERCSAFDALADALRTPDSWLAYRAMAYVRSSLCCQVIYWVLTWQHSMGYLFIIA